MEFGFLFHVLELGEQSFLQVKKETFSGMISREIVGFIFFFNLVSIS